MARFCGTHRLQSGVWMGELRRVRMARQWFRTGVAASRGGHLTSSVMDHLLRSPRTVMGKDSRVVSEGPGKVE